MKDQIRVIFFSNGNTGVFKGYQQIPELQQSWILMYMKFLEEHGIDPTACDVHLPGGYQAKPFKTSEGWNWEIFPKLHSIDQLKREIL